MLPNNEMELFARRIGAMFGKGLVEGIEASAGMKIVDLLGLAIAGVEKATPHQSSDLEFADRFVCNLVARGNYEHRWPKDVREIYTEVQCGKVSLDGVSYDAIVGKCRRETSGKDRLRTTVFLDNYPALEFVESNDETVLLSLIKIDKSHIRDATEIPREYDSFKIGNYSDYITGPYASKGLAVIVDKNDYTSMVLHALLRFAKRVEKH
jgi:hypothetical protein